MFVQTIGDPGRGEEIASAVLADDAARAEVVAPITRAVISTTGLTAAQQPFVASQVHLLLQDPAGARTFIDPFAGSWARMLGEDDPRPAQFDLVPLLEQFAATAPEGTVDTSAIADRLPVGGVPLPRTSLDWMGGVRDAVAVSILPLALVAVGCFAVAFATGDRRRVLRRLGWWAVAAGFAWVVLPPLLVSAARRWASGADAVVAVALDEGTSGLLPVAIALVAAGMLALAASFAVAPASAPRPATERRRRTTPEQAPGSAPDVPARRMARTTASSADPTAVVPRTPTVEPTAEIPVTQVASATDADPTVPLPATVRAAAPDETGDERDALWDYYGST